MSIKWGAIQKDLPAATVVFTTIQLAVFYTGSSAILALPMPLYDAQWGRVLTCTFAHADANHLWSNLIVQLIILPMFEWDAGTGAASLVYVLSAVCGSLAQAVAYTGPATILLGASGAVFGIIGGHLSTIMLNWGDGIQAPVIYFTVVVFYITKEVVTAATTESNVARFAHLIGALSGALIGLAVTVNVQKRSYEQYMRWNGAIGAFLCFVVLCVLYSLYGVHD